MYVRLIMAILAALVCVAAFAIGGTSLLVGFAEQRHADRAYIVGFVPGSGCDDAHELYLHVDDGAVLDCVSPGLGGSGRVRLPGFTNVQNEQVETLAEQLGRDGLSITEQQEIQNQVDGFAATVPASNRPYGDDAIAGSSRAWLGGGMVVGAVLALIGVLWFASPKQRPAR